MCTLSRAAIKGKKDGTIRGLELITGRTAKASSLCLGPEKKHSYLESLLSSLEAMLGGGATKGLTLE